MLPSVTRLWLIHSHVLLRRKCICLINQEYQFYSLLKVAYTLWFSPGSQLLALYMYVNQNETVLIGAGVSVYQRFFFLL